MIYFFAAFSFSNVIPGFMYCTKNSLLWLDITALTTRSKVSSLVSKKEPRQAPENLVVAWKYMVHSARRRALAIELRPASFTVLYFAATHGTVRNSKKKLHENEGEKKWDEERLNTSR